MLIPEASTSARLVDQAFLRTLVVELFFFIPITATIIYFALKYYERRHPVAENIEGSTLLEVLWTTIPLMLCLVIFYIGLIGFDKIREIPKDAMPIKVVGQQWTWHFFYENGRETGELRVPVKKPIKLVLTSRDVIHSFFVPAFRIKEDCVPGMENYLSFTVEEPGTYDIFCTEYCGLGHSGMVSKVAAMEEKEFAAWYAAAPAAGEESGKELLEKNGCLGCHSTDGTPKGGPDL